MEVARTSGADLVIDFTKEDAAKRVYKETNEKGADVVFEVSGNIKALPDAMRAAAYCGKVTVLSFYQDPATPVKFGNEFHHKRIQLKSSQMLGISPEISNTWDLARRRQAAIELVSELDIEPLISHRFEFEKTPEALEIIDNNPQDCNAIILKY
jgi:threonine dehydrogenase-like Zn-dependent dehydrogenase